MAFSQLRLQQLTGSIIDIAHSGSNSSATPASSAVDADLGAVLGQIAGAIGRISGKNDGDGGAGSFTNQAAGVFTHASTKFGSGGDEFEILESSDDVTLRNAKNDKDLIFQVTDNNALTEVFRLDGDVSALKVATTKQVQFGDAARHITDAGDDIVVTSGGDVVVAGTSKLEFNAADSGEHITGDGTDLTLASGAKINLTATSDVILPDSVGMLFGDVVAGGEKIEGDGTDLTIASSNLLNLTAATDVVIPASVGLVLDGSGDEKIESDGTDIDISVGTNGDVNLPQNIGLTFGDDGEKIEGNGSKLTVNAANLDLTMEANGDVTIPADIGLIFGDSTEKIEGNADDLTLASSRDIFLTATADVNIPAQVGLTFGNDLEKIEVDGSQHMTVQARGNLDLDSDAGLFNFRDDATLGLKIDLSTSAGDAIFKDAGDAEIFRLDGSADSLLMATVRPIQFRTADQNISSPDANKLKIEAVAGDVSVEGAGVQLSGSTGIGLSGSLAISADGGMTSAGGAQAGKMLFARYPEFATFRSRDLFSASTTVIGALNALADAAAGGVVASGIISASIAQNADVVLNGSTLGSPYAGHAAQIDGTSIEPANTEVYVNGQLLLSGNTAAGSNVGGGDYVVKSYADPAILKFAFRLEEDDVLFVKTSAQQ